MDINILEVRHPYFSERDPSSSSREWKIPGTSSRPEDHKILLEQNIENRSR
jgi:hypothetical protein